MSPCRVGSVHGKIQANERVGGTGVLPFGRFEAIRQHSQEKSATAANVQYDTGLFGFDYGPLDKLDVIGQHQASIPLFQLVCLALARLEPIIRGIVGPEFRRVRLGM